MRWQRRFDMVEKREVIELVLSEREASDIAEDASWDLPDKPEPRGGLAAIIGKWPGNETDEEIAEALEKLNGGDS